MKKGFTLVELSVVLVIVGVIVGGIMAGRSLASSSKIVSGIAQIQQFDAAIASFKAQYNALPGDDKAAGGDGDGLITAYPQWAGNITLYTCEFSNFWNNLDPEQFAAGGCTNSGVPVVTSGPNKNAPLSKLGIPGSFILVSGSSGSYWPAVDVSTSHNYYIIMSPGQIQYDGSYYRFLPTSATTGALSPADAFALDKKMDDGVANTGSVISGGISNTGGAFGAASESVTASSCNSSTSTYATGSDVAGCNPMIRLGSQVNEEK